MKHSYFPRDTLFLFEPKPWVVEMQRRFWMYYMLTSNLPDKEMIDKWLKELKPND